MDQKTRRSTSFGLEDYSKESDDNEDPFSDEEEGDEEAEEAGEDISLAKGELA